MYDFAQGTNVLIKLVPLSEMTQVLRKQPREGSVKENQYVRFKRGTYKGDLGQVYMVDEARNSCIVKVIPRLDYDFILQGISSGTSKVPAAKFFNSEDIKQHNHSNFLVEKRGEYDVFKGMKFQDGYLFKDASIKSLVSPSYYICVLIILWSIQ